MKVKFLRNLFSLALILCATTASAYDFNVDGIYYNQDGNNAIVTSGSTQYSGNVVIPETVTHNGTTYSVTGIGDAAFSRCSNLRSISIPNSVTSIGDAAFSRCSNLRSISIPNSVTSIGDAAFYYCYGLTSVTIPNSVTSIGNVVFAECTGLTSPVYNNHVFAFMPESFSGSYTIPEGIKSIAGSAFSSCSNLTSISIPNSVTEIGDYAFEDCSELTSVNIPNAVTSISCCVFSECSSLTSIDIPNSVTSIGDHAFYKCAGLTSINIPESVTEIGEYTFFVCSSLTSITIPNSVTSIGDWAFSGCTSLTSIVIPNFVTSFGKYTFRGCTGLTSVTIPNSVTSIGDWAFSDCTGLTSVTIPNSVTSIGDWAFSGCSELISVAIPNSVTSIGGWAFYGCSALIEVTIPESVEYIDSSSFNNTPFYTNNAYTTEDGVLYLKNILLGREDSYIYPRHLVVKNGTKVIIGYAFSNCYLDSVTIPNSVTIIHECAFYNNSKLKNVIIGNSVRTIGKNAFANCTVLDTLYCRATTPPTLKSGALPSTLSTIYVPKTAVEAYKNSSDWSSFNIVGFDYAKFSFTNLEGRLNKSFVLDIAMDNKFDVTSFQFDLVLPEGITAGTPTLSDRKAATHSISSAQVASGAVRIVALSSANDNFSGNEGTIVSVPLTIDEYIPSGAKAIKINNLGITVFDGSFVNVDNFEGSITVIKTNQVITWNQSITEIGIGAEIPLTATATSGLAVEYAITSGSSYAHIKNGNILVGDALGEVTVEARQKGNANYDAATAVSKTINVRNTQTITWTQDIDKVVVGTTTALTATASSGLPVTYAITQGSEFAHIDGTNLVADAVGEIVVTAIQAGGGNYGAVSMSRNVTIWLGYIIGDANSDNVVTIADVATTVDYILEKNPSPFNFDATDIDKDNRITVGDASRIVEILLQQPVAPSTQSRSVLKAGEMSNLKYMMTFKDNQLFISPDGNSDLYLAAQFDLELPEGVSVESVTVNGSDHKTAFATTAGGTTRVVVYSLSNENFAPNSDIVVNLSNLEGVDGEVKLMYGLLDRKFGDNIAEAPAAGTVVQLSGISTIEADGDDTCQIFNLNGVQMQGEKVSDVKNLAPGIYIVRTATGTNKVVVK